jgi:predicted TIM-barrel fold metal-dependent hydrolase
MTSAWSPKYLPEELLYFMPTHGKNRVMFATDRTVLSFERCHSEVAALERTDEVRQAWLHDNANAFFLGDG